jgi:hypothetical protein
MKKERLEITVVHVRRETWGDTTYQIIGRFPRFKKWWKFWENNYEDIPLEIIDLNTTNL